MAGNFPYEFHLITNYGILIYYFDVDLCDRNAIFPDYKKTLKPISKRMIHMNFD